MDLSRFSAPLEVKFAADEAASGTFSGYGAIFGNIDSYGDVIQKGAFSETLRQWKGQGKFPPMLLQHGDLFSGADMLPVGIWTSMEEDEIGLKVAGRLLGLDTERGKYLHAVMKEGAIDGMSIGYRAKKFVLGTKTGEPRRTIEQLDLVELSIVTFPANGKALVRDVKSGDQIDEINSLSDAEALLREAASFSKKDARDFVSRIVRLSRREAAAGQEASDLIAQLRATRANLTHQ